MSDEIYQRVVRRCQDIAAIQSTLALLEWDQQTCMPGAAGDYRVVQITTLSGELHRRRTHRDLGSDLQELRDSDWLSQQPERVQANVRQLHRDHERATKLPQQLVEELAQATSRGQMVWLEARKAKSFATFLPSLETIFSLKRQQAEALGFTESPYDALLDEFEPGVKSSEVATVLKDLCDALVPLIREIGESSRRPDTSILHRSYPIRDQESFGRLAAQKIGFDFDRGRLDVTHHPFCTELGPNDCRITTRYDANYFNMAFFGILHEAGHGLYEQGLPTDQYGLPAGHFASLGVHESQSRLWENLVGRSASFWRHFFPLALQQFPQSLSDVIEEDFYQAVNAVQPSLIRVEADEATYNLHIAIRFELERALIEGNMTCADLPSAWNEKYQSYLGITPQDDAEGVLQDIHWSAGLVGYFPTYSLGNLYASQLYEAIESETGDMGSHLSKGEFQPLKQWLNQRVHAWGQVKRPSDLMEQATGKPLSHDALLNHLRHKYTEVYRL